MLTLWEENGIIYYNAGNYYNSGLFGQVLPFRFFGIHGRLTYLNSGARCVTYKK